MFLEYYNYLFICEGESRTINAKANPEFLVREGINKCLLLRDVLTSWVNLLKLGAMGIVKAGPINVGIDPKKIGNGPIKGRSIPWRAG